MTKLQELKAQLALLKNNAATLINKEGVTAEELTAINNEITIVNQKIVAQKEIEATLTKEPAGIVENRSQGEETGEKLYNTAFFNVVSGKSLTNDQQTALAAAKNALSSATGEDGGYLIPNDQQVAIRELARSKPNLANLLTIENVNSSKGSRNLEKAGAQEPLKKVAEGATIGDLASPQFVNIAYSIEDYAGILTIPNDLKSDSKGLMAYLNKWIAAKIVATRNSLLLAEIAKQTKTAIAGIDDIKDALNVQLDPAIELQAEIITNQDGYNVLAKLKDSQGRYLLEPNPANKEQKLLLGKNVRVVSNKTLKTDTSSGKKAPIIIGSLKEYGIVFDRNQTSIKTTDIGGGAFETNTTKTRVIDRLDFKVKDSEAIVYGEITIA